MANSLLNRSTQSGWHVYITYPIAAAIIGAAAMWGLSWFREGNYSPRVLSGRIGTLETGDIQIREDIKDGRRALNDVAGDVKEIQGQIDQLSKDQNDKLDKILRKLNAR